MEPQDPPRRLATLQRHLAQHRLLARLYRAEFGPESGLVKVNATALWTTVRKLKALREHGDEARWYSTYLTEAEGEQAARWASGEEPTP